MMVQRFCIDYINERPYDLNLLDDYGMFKTDIKNMKESVQ